MPIKFIHGLFLFLFLHFSQETTAQDTNPPPPPLPLTPPQQPGQYSFGPKFNPQMAIIMIVLVSAFFFMGFFSVYIRQCAERGRLRGGDFEHTFFGGGSRRSRRAARGLETEVIESFPTFKYSAVKNFKIGKASLECAVCLNEFEDDETLRLIPKCSHVFHPVCIDSWLDSHVTCPVCRANLEPQPGEVITTPVYTFEPEPESDSGPKDGESDPQDVNLIGPSKSTNERRPPRTRSSGFRFSGLVPRSHSTGHSLVQPGENCERFTLTLPEEIRNEIMNSGLNRAKSCVAFPRARSSRTGFRSGSGKNNFNYERFNQEGKPDRWGFPSTPPFVSRNNSVHGGEEPVSTQPGSMLKFIKPPLDRLFLGIDNSNIGEKSSDRLRPDDQV